MKYVCDVCGWEYDEAVGYPEGGIAPGTKWEDIPEDFECPLCSVAKDMFSEGYGNTVIARRATPDVAIPVDRGDSRQSADWFAMTCFSTR